MNLRALYEDEELSLQQIAETTGQPYSRVRTQLIRAGVKLRERAVGAALRTDRRKPKRRGVRR
jgi:DNA-directed RNA polymerase specialized sigma24 family protein